MKAMHDVKTQSLFKWNEVELRKVSEQDLRYWNEVLVIGTLFGRSLDLFNLIGRLLGLNKMNYFNMFLLIHIWMGN